MNPGLRKINCRILKVPKSFISALIQKKGTDEHMFTYLYFPKQFSFEFNLVAKKSKWVTYAAAWAIGSWMEPPNGVTYAACSFGRGLS